MASPLSVRTNYMTRILLFLGLCRASLVLSQKYVLPIFLVVVVAAVKDTGNSVQMGKP